MYNSRSKSVPALPSELPEKEKTYNEILKSTSIVGGSQAINYGISMVRVKLVAILLGPSGVGMVGLYNSMIALLLQLTGFGIGSSGVRQIAKAHGAQDSQQIGKTVRVLRRASWLTGIFGWAVAAALSRPLSIWAFESADNAWLICIVGVTILLTSIAIGQRAIIQGTRRISDLAWMTVLSSMLSTIVGLALYLWLGIDGIVPVLISTALLNLALSWWYSRKIEVPQVDNLTWAEVFLEGKELTSLGAAFMWSGLLGALVDMSVRAFIVRDVGVEGAGCYQAAWALSGIFANVIVNAMQLDFYPRLTAAAKNHAMIQEMASEQIEIGMLIAVPGLVGTLAFGPLLLIVLYSIDFIAAADVLPWFVLGIFFRVVLWPTRIIILAKGATRWYFVTQTFLFGTQLFWAWVLIKSYGTVGAGMALCAAFVPATLLNLWIAHHLTEFVWSKTVLKFLLLGLATVLVAFLGAVFLSPVYSAIMSLPLTVAAAAFSVREISARVGEEHRLVRALAKIPVVNLLMPR